MMVMMSWEMSGGCLWDVQGMSGWCLPTWLFDFSWFPMMMIWRQRWWRQRWWRIVTWRYGEIALIGMVMTWPRTIGEVQMSWHLGGYSALGRRTTLHRGWSLTLQVHLPTAQGGDHWPHREVVPEFWISQILLGCDCTGCKVCLQYYNRHCHTWSQ